MSANSQEISELYYLVFKDSSAGRVLLEHLSRSLDLIPFSRDPYQHAHDAGKREILRIIRSQIAQHENNNKN